jgi:hypothetical protein
MGAVGVASEAEGIVTWPVVPDLLMALDRNKIGL